VIRDWLLALLALATTLAAAPVRADDFRPAYLQLTQQDAGKYDVLWKVPALGEDAVLNVEPAFPPGTVELSPQRRTYAAGASVTRWRISVPGGLEGKTIAFNGVSETRFDILARLVRTDGSVQLERVTPSDPIFKVEATVQAGPLVIVQTYTLLGIEHILVGFDHLCFVLALAMIVGFNRRLFWTITSFTAAHSITLALATMGVLRIPGPPIEAVIALSIVFVASEVIQRQRGRSGLAARKPWLVAFAFGLLHGLGFAGALAEIGLPANAIPLALLFFNIGVEIGQVLFVAVVFSASRLCDIAGNALRLDRARFATAATYLIGGVASYWTIERVVQFWI
jgi:hydrogenase/urease accessory protein HupE